MSETLKGKWGYRSFLHNPKIIKDVKGDANPQFATPWAPPAELEANTNEAGEVTGILTVVEGDAKGLALKITGRITPAADKLPASVEFTAEKTINGFPVVYRMKGFFGPGSDHVVGTVLSVAKDLKKEPDGTVGVFILFRAKA